MRGEFNMNEDDRPIEALMLPDGHIIVAVGESGVTAIRAYQEAGQMAWVTWFAVYEGEELTGRINSAGVGRVVYRKRRQG